MVNYSADIFLQICMDFHWHIQNSLSLYDLLHYQKFYAMPNLAELPNFILEKIMNFQN